KMYPPLRSLEDVAAVRAGLAEGVIDCVATDHAPHSAHEKDVPFDEAPRGVIGLETAASVVHATMGFDIATFFDRLAEGPRRILGAPSGLVEVGVPADLVVFAPDEEWIPDRFRSRSENSPWRGQVLRGRVEATFAGGELIYRKGET
ncbi:MAG: amidohydrolase family protein, partial [Acidimicrobiia bacterium]